MVPAFQADGLLPPGTHPCDWPEFCKRYGWNPERRKLLGGLRLLLLALKVAGCSTAYIDGSFVTSKDCPNDFDGLWDVQGVRATDLDPVLLNFSGKREAQKAKYGGEFFPMIPGNPVRAGQAGLDFFQTDKMTGNPKGIIVLDLRSAVL